MDSTLRGKLQNNLWSNLGLEENDPLVKLIPEAAHPLKPGNHGKYTEKEQIFKETKHFTRKQFAFMGLFNLAWL